MLSARNVAIEEVKNDGTVSFSDYQTEKNKIRKSLTDLISYIEENDDLPKSESNFAWLGVIVIIALFFGILLIKQEIAPELKNSQMIDNEYVPTVFWAKSRTWEF